MSEKLSQNLLLKVLRDKKLQPIHQPETDQIYIVMMVAHHEVPVFFAIRSNDTLLQTLAYIPYDLNPKTLAEVARLMHIINREVDMPGFGIDEIQKLMFYRCVIPCVNGVLDTRLVELYLAATKVALETFMKAITIVASGSATVDALMKQEKPRNTPPA